MLRIIVKSVYVKLRKAEKESKCTLDMKAFLKCVETLQRDRAMSKNTGELHVITR